MSSGEFVKHIFLIGILIFAATGLSLLDKESSFNKLNSDKALEDGFGASVVQTQGGGVVEEAIIQPKDVTTPFIEKESAPDFLPVRNWDVSDLDIGALAAIIYNPKSNKILYQKNIYESLPIASLTKLMTAVVVIETINLEDVVMVSKQAVMTEGEAGNLAVGEELTVKNLLYALLVESSNDAATALEEYFNTNLSSNTLVDAMNERALRMGLSETIFNNPSGLDENGIPSNFSSGIDIAVLVKYILEAKSIIPEIVSTHIIDIHSVDGRHSHHLVNSNKLLGVLPEIVGGKTGYTQKAGESLIVIFKPPSGNENDLLIGIVLNSKDRLGDTRTLLDWTKKAYMW